MRTQNKIGTIIRQYVHDRIGDGFIARDIAELIKADHADDYKVWTESLADRQLIAQIEAIANKMVAIDMDVPEQLEISEIVSRIVPELPRLQAAISYPIADGTTKYISWISATADMIIADNARDEEQIGNWRQRIRAKNALLVKRREMGIPDNMSILDWINAGNAVPA